MQAFFVTLVALGMPLSAHATDSPIGKVLSMISDLQAKIIQEGEAAQKEYAEFSEWCEDRSRNVGFEIKTGNSEVERLEASIAQEAATIASLTTKVDELTGGISLDQSDLNAATHIRTTEAADFAAEEKELVETIDMLRRATGILEREMAGGASMMQLNNAGNLAQAFDTMVQASLIPTADAARLAAFAQEAETDGDDAPGAPAAAVYKSQSGGVVDTLVDLTEKADAQLTETRKKEVSANQNFEMLKQSLEDEIRVANKEFGEAKKGISESTERKAAAVGDLGVTSKEIAADVKAKSTLHHDCMSRAQAFQAETNSRGEELKALATAKKIIEESTGGAALNQVSFVQVVSGSILTSGRDLHRYEAVRLVRDLAHEHHSAALVQLASQMAAALHSRDAFEKVKGLISEMISKLENEAGADASKKAYCDKELAESNVKKADKSNEIAKLSTKIDQMSARSAQLKEEVAALQSELSQLAMPQAEMDKLRSEQRASFDDGKADLEKGLTGIKFALKILNEYYALDSKAHEAAEGAGSGIVGLLEVCEADFSKNLAQITTDEEAAVAEFEQVTKDNEIEKASKDQSEKYKNHESNQLDKTSAELTSDRNGVNAELDAVLEYLSKIEAECIAKAETYKARKEHREAEIAGLKEALQILESETAFVQRHAARRVLRGATLSVAA